MTAYLKQHAKNNAISDWRCLRFFDDTLPITKQSEESPSSLSAEQFDKYRFLVTQSRLERSVHFFVSFLGEILTIISNRRGEERSKSETDGRNAWQWACY
jgi:hypothetical protein